MPAAANSIFRSPALLLGDRALGFVVAFGIPVVLARVFPVSEFGTCRQTFLIYGASLAIAQIGMTESLYYFLPANPGKKGGRAAKTLLVLGLSDLICLVLVWLGKNGVADLLNNPSLPGYLYLPVAGAFLALGPAAILLEITMNTRRRFRMAAGTYTVSEVLGAGFSLVPMVPLFGGLEALFSRGATKTYLWRPLGAGFRPDWRALGQRLAPQPPDRLIQAMGLVERKPHRKGMRP